MVRRVDDPRRPALPARPVAKPRLPPSPTGHSSRSSLTADGAARARAAIATGKAPSATRTPEVVKQEIVNLDRTLSKKGLNPGLLRELQTERTERTTEYRQVLQQSIANLTTTSKRLGGEDAKALNAQVAAYRAELEGLSPKTATSATSAVTASSSTLVEDAAAKVSDAYASGGAKAAMVELEKQTLTMSQAAAAKLIEASKPVIDKVAKDLTGKDSRDAEQALTSLSHAAKLGGPAATQQVATQLAGAVTETSARGGVATRLGNLDNGFEAAIKAGAGADLALAVQAELVKTGKTASAGKIGNAALDAIRGPVEAYGKAKEEYAKLEAKLGQDLAMLGPGMTPTERQKYADAFWADEKNKKVKDAFAGAENALSASMKNNGPALEAAAARGDTKAAELLMQGVQALATSPNHAKEAIDFVDRLGRPGNKALFDALNKDGKLEDRIADDLLAPALGNAQSKAMTDGSMDELLGQLKSIKSLGKNFSKLPGQLTAAIDTVDKVTSLLAAGKSGREIMTALRLDRLTDKWADKSKLGKALAVFGVVSSIVKAGNTTDGLDKLKASLSAVEGGLELTAGVLGTLGRAQKLVGAAKGAELLSKYLPFVGLAVDGAQLASDIRKLMNGGNAGDAIATVGTVINLIGDVAGVVPILGTAVDGVLGTVGTIIQGIGGLVSGLINGNEAREQREKDRAKYLKQAGVSQANRDLLTGGSFIDLSALGTMGLSRDQFLGALKAQHNLPTDDQGKSAYAVQMAWGAAAAYGLTGTDAVKFVADLQKKIVSMSWSDLDRLNRMLDEVAGLASAASFDGRSPDEIRQLLDDRLQTLDLVFQQTAGDVYKQWKLDGRDEDDVNLSYFSTWDAR
jgi:hypothetical protein